MGKPTHIKLVHGCVLLAIAHAKYNPLRGTINQFMALFILVGSRSSLYYTDISISVVGTDCSARSYISIPSCNANLYICTQINHSYWPNGINLGLAYVLRIKQCRMCDRNLASIIFFFSVLLSFCWLFSLMVAVNESIYEVVSLEKPSSLYSWNPSCRRLHPQMIIYAFAWSGARP